MRETKQIKRISLTFLLVCFSLVLFRPFLAERIILRADAYFSFGMFNDAIRQYRKAIFLDPRNNYARNWLAYSYKNLGNIEKAISAYEKALAVDSNNRIALCDLGMIYVEAEEFKLAKEYFSKASSIPLKNKDDKEDVFYHHASLVMLSFCQERLGEIEEAIESNRKMLSLYPNRKSAKERIKRLKSLKR